MKKVKIISTKRVNKKTIALAICPTCENNYETRLDYLVEKEYKAECKSCACRRKKLKHGKSGSKLHRLWISMRSRCKDKNNKGYKNYGGRGITVCTDWDDFSVFRKWCINNGYKKGLTIDRANNDEGYSPDNCRFVDWFVQNQNTRKLRTRNKTGYRGVCFNSNANKYMAEVCNYGKRHYLGLYDTALSAAKAYDDFVISNRFNNTINDV